MIFSSGPLLQILMITLLYLENCVPSADIVRSRECKFL